MEDGILCILLMLTYVLTIYIAKQERKAHMVAYAMIRVACAFINILHR